MLIPAVFSLQVLSLIVEWKEFQVLDHSSKFKFLMFYSHSGQEKKNPFWLEGGQFSQALFSGSGGDPSLFSPPCGAILEDRTWGWGGQDK